MVAVRTLTLGCHRPPREYPLVGLLFWTAIVHYWAEGLQLLLLMVTVRSALSSSEELSFWACCDSPCLKLNFTSWNSLEKLHTRVEHTSLSQPCAGTASRRVHRRRVCSRSACACAWWGWRTGWRPSRTPRTCVAFPLKSRTWFTHYDQVNFATSDHAWACHALSSFHIDLHWKTTASTLRL